MTDTSIPPTIEPIKIMLDTNIPGKQAFTLTSSMIYHPSIKQMPELSEYPFLTMDRDYSQALTSYLNRQTYEKKVKFFFNKDSHIKVLSIVGLYTPNKEVKETESNNKNKESKETDSKQKKELNEEIDELIRNINIKKTKKLKELEDQYKSERKTKEQDLKEQRNTESKLESKPESTEDDKNKIKDKIEKLKEELKSGLEKKYETDKKDQITKFNYQLKCVKYGFINVSQDNKYILEIPSKSEIDKKKITDLKSGFYTEEDKYNPLYSKPDGSPQYRNPVLENLEKDKKGEKIEKNENEKDENTMYKFANENVMVLLKILFPNNFPVLNYISESYKLMILNESMPFTFKNSIPTFLRPNSYVSQFYSYLKIDGKTYTTTQVIWLNDIYNHPIYGGLVDKFKQFNILKQSFKGKLGKNLEKKRIRFKEDFKEKGKFAIDEKLVDFFDRQKKPEPEKNVFGSDETRKLNLEIDRIIEDIRTLIEYFDFTPPKYNLILDVTNSIRQRYKRVEDQIVKTNIIDTKLTRLIKSINEINVFETIFTKFIDTDEIVLNYDSEPDNIKTELKTNYAFYMTFVDTLKGFIQPTRESTNRNLQDILEDFAGGIAQDQTLFSTLMTPKKWLIEGDKTLLNTGVSLLPVTGKDPRFEIYVQLNIIEGELNDDNKSKINCIYKGEYLGTMLDQLLYPQKTKWELNKKRLFFNLNDKEAQKEIKEKEPIKQPTPVEGSRNAPAVKGGKRTYRQLPIYKLGGRWTRRK